MNLVNIRYDENGEGIFTLKSDDPKDTEYNRDYPRERLAKYVEKDYWWSACEKLDSERTTFVSKFYLHIWILRIEERFHRYVYKFRGNVCQSIHWTRIYLV